MRKLKKFTKKSISVKKLDSPSKVSHRSKRVLKFKLKKLAIINSMNIFKIKGDKNLSKKNYSSVGKYNYAVISELSNAEYEKLPIRFQKRFIRDKLRRINLRRRRLSNKYSKSVLNGKSLISFDNPLKAVNLKSNDLKQRVINVSDLRKSYFSGVVESRILHNLNFTIERGDFITILGPSGSGKTTLLNLLSGLDNVTTGDIFVDGINLSILKDRDLTTFRKRKIGFVFQQYNLLPNLNAYENIEVGYNLSTKRDKKYINSIIETIGLKQHLKKYPYQLSGGQQQRVSIARALAKNPSILFCDEPTGALDEETGKIVLKVLKDVNRSFKTTVIVVTHNPNIAKISDGVLSVRDGLIKNYYTQKSANVDDIKWA